MSPDDRLSYQTPVEISVVAVGENQSKYAFETISFAPVGSVAGSTGIDVKVFTPPTVCTVVVRRLFVVICVSVAVTYLFALQGVPVVPAIASFSSCEGILGSVVATSIGSVALTGATDTFLIPKTLVEESVAGIV